MNLATPSVQDVSTNLVAQLQASLGQTLSFLPKSFSQVLARVLAGVFILLYKYAGATALNQFVRYASALPTEVNGVTLRPLIEWGRLIGIGDPIPATAAELVLDVPVLNQVGSLAAGTQMTCRDNGVTYLTIASVALNAAVVHPTVRAVSDQVGGQGLGTIGNLEAGATISFANPQASVARDATVASQAVTGANEEDIEAYRERVLERFQAQPQGGAYADYRLWGREAAGVRNIYPYAASSPGEVDIFVESATEYDGIPTTAQLTAVYNIINLDESGQATRRPVGAAINVYPISRTSFDVIIYGLAADDTAAVLADVTTALDDLLRSTEPYIVGLSVLPRRDRISQSSVSGLVDQVVSAAGGTFRTLSLVLSPDPINAYTLHPGEKAKFGFAYTAP